MVTIRVKFRLTDVWKNNESLVCQYKGCWMYWMYIFKYICQ